MSLCTAGEFVTATATAAFRRCRRNFAAAAAAAAVASRTIDSNSEVFYVGQLCSGTNQMAANSDFNHWLRLDSCCLSRLQCRFVFRAAYGNST